MGYATVRNVPSAFTHEKAKKIYDDSKPIRGKDVRPLGARRDYHQYSVNQNEQGDIEFICYRTPVVTYHKDDTITIRNGGWSSVSTHQFIEWVLGIQANGYKGNTALTIKKQKIIMDSDTGIRLKWEGFGGDWKILSEIKGAFGYRINRKAANNVRARYKPFADYFKGYIKLRSETISRRWGADYTGIRISAQELVAAFGMSNFHPDQAVWPGMNELLQKKSKRYEHAAGEMIELITSNDLEKWNKAALWFFGHDHTVNVAILPVKQFDTDYYLTRNANFGFKQFDEFILKFHSNETIERVKVVDGKLPNLKYADWVEKE